MLWPSRNEAGDGVNDGAAAVAAAYLAGRVANSRFMVPQDTAMASIRVSVELG